MPKGIDYPPKDEHDQDPSVDRLVEALGNDMAGAAKEAQKRKVLNDAARRAASDRRYEERMYAKTAARHEREAQEHTERLESAKARLKEEKRAREEAAVRRDEIRARLGVLERLASRSEVEAEAVALEEELHRLERPRTKRAAVKEATEDASRYPVPAVVGERVPKGTDEPISMSRLKGEHVVTPSEESPAILLEDLSGMTPKEHREAQRTLVRRIEDAPKQSEAPQEREAMKVAEKAYLTAYKEFERKRGVWNRLRHGKELADEEQKVAALKRQYDEARVSYANALTRQVQNAVGTRSAAAEERMERKYQKLKETGAEGDFDAYKAARYERTAAYLRARALVRGVGDKIEAARLEGMNERQRGTFGKGLQWLAHQNQKLEKLPGGKSTAIATRALIGAIGISGIGAAVGATGAVTLLGLAGYGSYRVARGLIGAFGGKLLGDAAGTFYEKRLGEADRAAAALSMRKQGREGLSGAVTVEDLQAMDADMRKYAIRAAGEVDIGKGLIRIKKKDLVRGVVAGIGGAGLSISTLELLSGVPGVERAVERIVDPTPESTEAMVASERASTPPLAEATVARGEGFNHLFAELPASKVENPTAVAQYLANTPASELSAKVGALAGGESALVHPGDRLYLDANQNLYFERSGEEPQLLMRNTDGGIEFHKVELTLRPDVPAQAPPVGIPPESRAAPEADIDALERAQTAALNQDQLDGEHTAPVEAAPLGIVEDPATAPATEPSGTRTIEDSIRDAQGGPERAVSSGNMEDSGARTERTIEDSIRDATPRAESFTNAHGVTVSPETPAAYTFKLPNATQEYTVMSGGTPEEASQAAQRYADAHPGTKIYFLTPVTDPLTGMRMNRLDAWDSEQGGPAQKFEGIVQSPRSQVPLPDLNPQHFIRKLPF